MNILIVFAHPEPASFNGALKNVAVRELERMGHTVVVSDLYRMGWNPALGPGDFQGERANADYLDLSREQEHAFATNGHSADVKAEQDKVKAADFVLFQFPVWWFSMPSILKGWVDRVFSRGFAYSTGRKYESGHFKGKRAMLCITTGTASTLYEPNGIDGDLHHVLWPIHNGILGYTGFTVLPPFAAWMPARVPPLAPRVHRGRGSRQGGGLLRVRRRGALDGFPLPRGVPRRSERPGRRRLHGLAIPLVQPGKRSTPAL